MIRISHLDHCSCLLFAIPLLPFSLSQSILHSAARGILLNPKTNHIPSLLTSLWCPLVHSKWKSKLCPWPPPSLTSSPTTFSQSTTQPPWPYFNSSHTLHCKLFPTSRPSHSFLLCLEYSVQILTQSISQPHVDIGSPSTTLLSRFHHFP